MEFLAQYATLIVGIIGMLAFVVSLITQLLKDLPGIEKVPTKLFVIIVSLIVTLAALFMYVAFAGLQLLWYYVLLAIFAALVVAFIAIYGWDTFKELKDRFIIE